MPLLFAREKIKRVKHVPFNSRALVSTEAMAKPMVLMTTPMLPDLESALDAKFNLVRLWSDDEKQLLARNAEKVRGLVVSHKVGADRSLIDTLPKLEIVSTFTVGLDKVDLEACKQRGITVTNTPDVLTDETADLALALILTTMRRICPADRYVRDGLWPVHGDFPLSYKVSGKRVGIVGLGRIGAAIAKRAEGFDCTISYFSRGKKQVSYKHYDNLVAMAKDSDILVAACALSEETHHIIDKNVLEALGPDGTLINIARGPVVDEVEMVKALVEKRLGAAGLDVFENEPHVPEELLSMDNVVLLPHVGSATWDTRRSMANLVVSNLEAHFAGLPLLSPVKL